MPDKTQKIGLCVMLEENKSNYLSIYLYVISVHSDLLNDLKKILQSISSMQNRISMCVLALALFDWTTF